MSSWWFLNVSTGCKHGALGSWDDLPLGAGFSLWYNDMFPASLIWGVISRQPITAFVRRRMITRSCRWWIVHRALS